MTRLGITAVIVGAVLVALVAGTSYAQGDNFANRELCLADCRYQYGTHRPGWRPYQRGLIPGQGFAYCAQRCDKQFWRDVERDVEED